MSSSSRSASGLPEPLQRHLGALYRFAQMLTDDADEAATCVEATYRRALRHWPDERDRLQQKSTLYQLLLDTCTGIGEFEEASSPLESRLAMAYLLQRLPVALAQLSTQHQLLLMLCTAEHLVPGDAARVLDLPAANARAELQAARDALRETLLDQASPSERALLQPHHLTDERLDAVLEDVLASDPVAPPSSLRRRLATLEPAASRPASRPDADVPARTREENGETHPARRLLVVALLIVTAGLLGLLTMRLDPSSAPSQPSLIDQAARQAPSVKTVLNTRDAERAAQFIQTKMGRRLTVPVLDSTQLTGVGISVPASNVHVPVLLYEDQHTQAPLVLYAYTYALLDKLGERFTFPEDALRTLQEQDGMATRTVGERDVLIWRDRDDIFLAVTKGDAATLQQRLAKGER